MYTHSVKRHLALLLLPALLLGPASCADKPDGKDEQSVYMGETLPAVLEDQVQYAKEHVGTGPEKKVDFTPEETVDPSTLKGKVLCGFQGWFGCGNDGCPGVGWAHWAPSVPIFSTKESDNMTVEMFPDISEYLASGTSAIVFKPLGDDTPAKLFSSCRPEILETQFSWMKEYGIDGIAMQRFSVGAGTKPMLHMNKVAGNVKRLAEKYGRVFYLTYDVSGMSSMNDWVQRIQKDFTEVIEGELGLTDSPQYLHENGKPVVQLWGIGVKGNFERPAAECMEMIQWFKDKGFYVIGGTPTSWRESNGDSAEGFQEVYKLYDMISPWTIGRYKTEKTAASHYKNVVSRDLEYCAENGLDYMPVMYPGFAWSKWNNGTKNMIPRSGGSFLWEQMKLAAGIEPTCIYMAMFDEYDEGTAMMKAASDSYMLPRGSYFLTLSADGRFFSTDFYLRLLGTFTNRFKAGKVEGDVPVVNTQGPVWLRTGFEKGMDPMPDTKEKFTAVAENLTKLDGSAYMVEIADVEHAPLNKSVLALKGANAGGARLRHTLMETSIPVTEATKLRYIKYCENEEGARAYIDLVFDDGTRLSESDARDYRGLKAGDVVSGGDAWLDIRYNLGQNLSGKTITKIELCYEGGQTAADAIAYFDDLIISDDVIAETDLSYNMKDEK